MGEGKYLMPVCIFCKEELTDEDGNEVCQTCWDKYKDVEYEVEFKVIGTFTDQVYDSDNEDEATELVLDRLRTDPISITETDVEVIQVRRSEVIDHHKVRLFRTDIVVDHTDKGDE